MTSEYLLYFLHNLICEKKDEKNGKKNPIRRDETKKILSQEFGPALSS
jgi:hypothetical protein